MRSEHYTFPVQIIIFPEFISHYSAVQALSNYFRKLGLLFADFVSMQSTGLNRSRGLPPPRFQNPVRLSSVWQGQDVSSELLRWQTTHEATTVMLKMYRDPGSRDVLELGTSVKESHRKQPEPAQERGCTDCSWLGHRSRDFQAFEVYTTPI